MKLSKKMLSVLALASSMLPAMAGTLDISDGAWTITAGTSNTLTYTVNGTTIIKNAYVTALDESYNTMSSKDYPNCALTSKSISDGFGTGKQYTYRFSGKSGQNDLEQNIYIYTNQPYILVEASVIASSGTTSSTKICPIVSETTNTLSVLGSSNNRVYNMPFANDNWATFSTINWEIGQQVISCEATSLFNVDTRKAIVLGSIDHSTWKSAIYVTPNGSNRLRKLTAEAGYISERTWDIVNNKASSERHGAVKGARVSSPRFMLGVFDDWRNGMETYADANAVLCPKYVWTKDESLFGWQSWGGMEFGLNYTSAMSLLDFFEKELKPVGFYNKQGRCHLVLDSGWNALTDEQLREYANRCKELGFVAGIYTTPFTYWGGEDAVTGNYEWEGGRLGEMVLKTGGKYRHINGWSLDPTHPAVKEWNRRTFQKFRDLGFEFVKIDFMNNGSQEADSWYDPNITTGMMAYNYGMDYIKEFCGDDDIMLDFSIAPIFPNKAHVRRIGCDAWGDLPQSMYTLNCIEGSWWLDRLYSFNDPDHMCMSKVKFSGKGSNDEQEARIRYTCGLITGMTLLGGTYAYEGEVRGNYGLVVGYDEERARAVKFTSNKDLLEVGRIGKSFRPVAGTFSYTTTLFSQNDVSVDNEFIMDTPDAFYYVVFNYENKGALNFAPNFQRLGVDASEFVRVTELFETKTYSNAATMQISVPNKDVRIYRFERAGYGKTETTLTDPTGSVKVGFFDGELQVAASEPVSSVNVYGIDGTQLASYTAKGEADTVTLPVKSGNSVVIASVTLQSGNTAVRKVLAR